MPRIGESDYRSGAKERLTEAQLLLSQGRLSGGIYLAGRAVEGILRAVIWKSDPGYRSGKRSLETGHDLRELLKVARGIATLRNAKVWDAINDDVQAGARRWTNNMRFMPLTAINRMWYDAGEIGGKRRVKQAARDFVEACSAVVNRCETIWQRDGR